MIEIIVAFVIGVCVGAFLVLGQYVYINDMALKKTRQTNRKLFEDLAKELNTLGIIL